jgi:hypothetical protein
MKDGFDLTVKFRLKYLAIYVIAIVGCVVALTIGYSRADANLRQTIAFGSSLLGATVAIWYPAIHGAKYTQGER